MLWNILCLFLEFSLCLSRACLGKMIVFRYKWLKKTDPSHYLCDPAGSNTLKVQSNAEIGLSSRARGSVSIHRSNSTIDNPKTYIGLQRHVRICLCVCVSRRATWGGGCARGCAVAGGALQRDRWGSWGDVGEGHCGPMSAKRWPTWTFH